METLTANEAKTHFGELLFKAQSMPVQISRNGKPVAVMVSLDQYRDMEAMKLRQLEERVEQARKDAEAGRLADGEGFFEALESGRFDE